MAANDDVLIVGKLDDKALLDSIDNLINEVANKSQLMANTFESAMDKMSTAMKDFAITQKVSVSLMKESWKEMSTAFDAMFAAEKSATGGGKGSGTGKGYDDNTIGALEEEIKLEEKKRKEMVLNSDELIKQNELIEKRKKLLKDEKNLGTIEDYKKYVKDSFGTINALSDKTLPKAQEKLRKLIELQKKYSDIEVYDPKQWNRLDSAIDAVSKKIENFKKKGLTSTGSIPDNVTDIKNLMPEKSIDEIAAKMKALRQVKTQDANETKILSDEYQRLKRRQHELMGSNVQLTKSNNYLAQSFGYIRNRIVYALTLGAITNFTKQIYEVRGQYELLERSLGVLLNSFERGSQVFQELNKMAIESPFTLMELATGAKQLTAYNFAANEVVDTTRRLADISAALGVPMERLVYNLGQIRAQTRLTARDARDFANAGLPIISALAERYSELEGKVVTTGDVYDRMTKKMVSYNDVMAVLNNMTDSSGKFFEFQAKQAQTLRVQMANLTLAWNNMLNEMGKANQSLLTLPVSGLKKLLQNWKDIDRVLKSVIISFGVLKAAQVVVLYGMTNMTLKMAAMTVAGKTLSAMFIGLGHTMKVLFANPWTWVFVGITAMIDLAGQIDNANAAVHELNEEIRNNAKEASQSMLDFMNNKGTKATIELAKANKLTTEEGQKGWEAMRKQIEQSAMSSNELIAKLLSIDDVNERIRKGFDFTESIQKSQAALADLKDYDIKITSDTGWWGMFGEGLISDLKDYTKEVENFKGSYLDFKRIIETSAGDNNPLKINYKEFSKELDETANSINNFIKEHNITDPLQINEILERVRAKIKEKNPEIRGEAANLFDLELDKKMSVLTNNAVDENASLWAIFMERLKHQSSATFQDVNDDWISSGEKLSKEQQDAIDENLKYFKDSMPYAYEAVAKMVADASKLKIHIGIAFGVQQLSEFQKEVNKRVKEKYGQIGADQFNALLPTAEDNLDSFVKTQQEAIAKLEDSNKKYEKDKTEWAKRHVAENNTEIEQRKQMLDLFNQSYKKDKKTGTSKKDILGDALQREIQLISDMQKMYKEYQKAGVDLDTARIAAAKEYEKTLKSINSVLSKYGIKGLTGEDLVSMDAHVLRDYYIQLRDIANLKGNTKGVEALEKAIRGLNSEIVKINYKKVTEGLNNELGKLKEDYELGIAIDADPELGEFIASAFGVNLEELPRTFGDAVKQAQKAIDKEFQKAGGYEKFGLKSIDINKLLDKNEFDKFFADSKIDMSSDLAKTVSNFRNYLVGLRRKEIEEQTANWNKLIEKYGEYEAKVNEIHKKALEERLLFAQQFGTEEQKSQAVLLRTQILAEKDPQAKQELINQLKELVNSIAMDDETRLKILTAIDTSENQSLARLDFEEFQKTPEWITATGDLAGMTRSAINGLIASIKQYKRTAKDLDPKQIKQINQALKNLYKQQRSGNPFHAIGDAMAEARERLEAFRPDIERLNKQIDELEKKRQSGQKLSKQELEQLDKLKKELKSYMDVGKLSATEIVNGINEAVNSATTATEMFTKMAKAIGGKNMTQAAETITKVVNTLQMAGAGASMGAQIGSGYGAIIGAVVGGVAGVVTNWADEISGNADITDAVNASINAVKMLDNTYKKLAYTMENTYGVAAVGAEQAIIANKKLQLAEIQRQWQLEQSRDQKNRDEDRIRDLEGQIIELEQEIQDKTNEVVNNLLGISGIGDAMESIMDGFIDALRNGEDAMASFDESINDMIASMVKKLLITQVLEPWFTEQWNKIQDDINSRKESADDVYAKAQQEYNYRSNIAENAYDDDMETYRDDVASILAGYFNTSVEDVMQDFDSYLRKYVADAENEMLEKQHLMTQASEITEDDIRKYAQYLREGRPIMEEKISEINDLLKELNLFDDAAKTKLSALQQGIQGVTEDTAGAIEAYMNGVSQQVYLHSDLLTQIRDTIVGFNFDVQVATMSEMLLQLRDSYQLMQSMATMMDNWQTAAGNGIRVELLS